MKNNILTAEAGLVYYDKTNDPHCRHDPERRHLRSCYYAPTLIGVSSWVSACGYVEYPDVYGRITHVLNWIQGITGNNL